MIKDKKLKVVLVQNSPLLMAKQENIKKCRELISNYSEEDNIDIVMFPQMSFTGYNFENYEHAVPMAVQINSGLDFKFAKQISINLKAYVIFGYIQKVKSKQIESNNQKISSQYLLFNAGAVINREGQVILNFHKTHLYFCDYLWAQQGQGFADVLIKNIKGQQFKCALGICMDINQKDFQSGQNQWADFINKTNAEIILFISNWTDSSPQKNNQEEALNIYNYWLYRLMPLIGNEKSQKIMFVCDRVGKQYNYHQKKQGYFHGNSGAVYLNSCKIISFLDKKQEKSIILETKLKINKKDT